MSKLVSLEDAQQITELSSDGYRRNEAILKCDSSLEAKMRMRSHIYRAVLGVLMVCLTLPTYAAHEVDHRYTIWGRVMRTDGVPAAKTNVLVTARGGQILGETTTEVDGTYRVGLHVHNAMLGKMFFVSVGNTTASGEFTFNPTNNRTERLHELNPLIQLDDL